MEKEIKKPNLDLEVKVEVTGVQSLENNLEEVKKMALALEEFYTKEKFIEEGTEIDFENEEQQKEINSKRDSAKEEAKKINAFKNAINDKFKEAMEIYNKPIEKSLTLKKETIDVIEKTRQVVLSQVDIVDSQLLAKKKEKFKKYFEEMAIKETIDFITYEDMRQNITLSAGIKSLKEEINTFVLKIKDELNLIESEEFKDEILVEYKKFLNVANAITTVKNRKKEIEEIKAREIARQEQLKQQKETVKKVEVVLEKPKVIGVKQESTEDKIAITTLTIKNETKARLMEVIKFLEDGGYDYE